MPVCAITNGMSASCDDLTRIGGVNKRAWVFNLEDQYGKPDYTTDVDGYVTAITFPTYAGTYKFETKKNSHTGGYTIVSAEGGNKFFQHDVTMKLFATTPADDDVIRELLPANTVVILETNNQEFLIYGANNGLECLEGTQNSGQADNADTTTNLTFQGAEKQPPLRFFVTDYATTLTTLEGYEI